MSPTREIAVGIAKVNRRRVIAERYFALDGDPVLPQALAPRGEFVCRHAESDMAGADCAV